MYLVKAERRGEIRPQMLPVTERRAMAEALTVALAEDQLRVHYQPVVDLIDESIVGFEALVRRQRPDAGLVMPGDFLSVAEDAGLGLALGRIVLELAIDDFGTGYSSLTHLREFAVDVLKIDQSFVSGICERTSDAGIVRAVVGLAQAMDLGTIAEGVEQPEQAVALRDAGCVRAQGYLFGRPAAPETFDCVILPAASAAEG